MVWSRKQSDVHHFGFPNLKISECIRNSVDLSTWGVVRKRACCLLWDCFGGPPGLIWAVLLSYKKERCLHHNRHYLFVVPERIKSDWIDSWFQTLTKLVRRARLRAWWCGMSQKLFRSIASSSSCFCGFLFTLELAFEALWLFKKQSLNWKTDQMC